MSSPNAERARDVAETAVLPFVKWVGGKRWLAQKHAALLPVPTSGGRVCIPFLGGGAIAFHYSALGHRGLLLSDTNVHLITTYRAVRDRVEHVISDLTRIENIGYDRDHYQQIVGHLNSRCGGDVMRAAWFITVNRWGFNGIWRVNKRGLCNVPFGKPGTSGGVPKLCDAEALRACSRALQGATIEVLDFDEQIGRLGPRRGDAVYLDPPYVPASKTSNFTGYTEGGFGPFDQERLVAVLDLLDLHGVRWALSNSDTPEARALYQRPGWNVLRLERSGTVSSDPTNRGGVGEILVRNFT